MEYKRPSWDEYFIGIMKQVGTRATCDRGRSGCVIVKDNRILVTGYVGSPIGIKHCDEIGHEIRRLIDEDGKESQHCVRTIHAEQNAICQAAKLGVSLEGGTIYVRMTPCYTCAKMLINCGIKRVVALQDYHASEETKHVFREAGIQFDLLNGDVVQYEKM
jgi:dCMP deaminase